MPLGCKRFAFECLHQIGFCELRQFGHAFTKLWTIAWRQFNQPRMFGTSKVVDVTKIPFGIRWRRQLSKQVSDHANATGTSGTTHVDVLAGSQTGNAKLNRLPSRRLPFDVTRTDQCCGRFEWYAVAIARPAQIVYANKGFQVNGRRVLVFVHLCFGRRSIEMVQIEIEVVQEERWRIREVSQLRRFETLCSSNFRSNLCSSNTRLLNRL